MTKAVFDYMLLCNMHGVHENSYNYNANNIDSILDDEESSSGADSHCCQVLLHNNRLNTVNYFSMLCTNLTELAILRKHYSLNNVLVAMLNIRY